MDGRGEYDLRGVGCLACDMIRLAGLDLFSVLDTPVCFGQSNGFSTAAGGFALWLAAWKTVTLLRQAVAVAAARDCF